MITYQQMSKRSLFIYKLDSKGYLRHDSYELVIRLGSDRSYSTQFTHACMIT